MVPRFLYAGEQERGLDAVEDLASGGVLSFNLAPRCGSWARETP